MTGELSQSLKTWLGLRTYGQASASAGCFLAGKLRSTPWPTKTPAQVIDEVASALPAFIQDYLFVVLFQACAESLASENASRLASMQRAEKSIDGMLDDLNRNFHRLRQEGIDEELFDVIAGFEALTRKKFQTKSGSVTDS